MWEVCQALIVHELGGLAQSPTHFDIEEVYRHTTASTPVIFIHPPPPGKAAIDLKSMR